MGKEVSIMGYMTASQAAEKWNISQRRVNAKKPIDNRKKGNK